MGKINKEWHAANPMKQGAKMDERIAWHLAHARNCGCREVPRLVAAEMAARGIKIPRREG